jgi:hypothetical protein
MPAVERDVFIALFCSTSQASPMGTSGSTSRYFNIWVSKGCIASAQSW